MNTNTFFNVSEKIGESVGKYIVCRRKYNNFLKFTAKIRMMSNSAHEKCENIMDFLSQSERAYVVRERELIKLRDEYIKNL